jgi:hypothetical protein
MDYLIGSVSSVAVLGGIPVIAYHISRFVDRFTK